MKNKYFLFSISLAVSIFGIMILSIVLENEVFSQIVQAITFPFLLFTIISCVFSIGENMITECKNKRDLEEQKLNIWNWYKEIAFSKKYQVEKCENPKTKTELEINKSIEISEKREKEVALQIKEFCKNIVIYDMMIHKIRNNKVVQILYIISLTLLIISMMLSPLLSGLFEKVPTITITLLSLFLTIMEILIKDNLTNWLIGLLIVKHNKKYNEQLKEHTNGQTENDV